MSPSIIRKAGAIALACASTAFATYTLDDEYSGAGFFDKFDFKTELDPSNGYVDYQTQAASLGSGDKYLIKYDDTTKTNYMGVDYWSVPSSDARGRASVRIESKETYQYGLFIVDLAHMPSSTCGLWPAFWTASHVDYPSQGEIDILENIHKNTVSVQTLHTYPGCNITGNQIVKQQTAAQVTYNCDDTAQGSDYGAQYLNQGCTATNSDANSYGDTFNKAGGGVYAMEWTSDTISIWNFEAGSVPSDISSGKPVPSGWGLPAFTTAHSTCNIDKYFKDHHLIFNTDFCGAWAGQDGIWQSSGCYDAELYPSCTSYVKANPSAFKDAYWSINSLKVYKDTVAPSSTSSTVSSTSTSTTSSTSTSASASTTSSASVTGSATSSTFSSVPYGNASVSLGGGGSGEMTTSTVYATSVYTITSCAATVTDCPARLGSVTTETIALYTTVCPVSGSTPTTAPYPTKKYYTSTILSTITYTITSCAPTVTNCPAKLGKVTTEVITSTKLIEYTPSAMYSVAPTGTGSVKTTAGGVSSPTITPVTGGAVSVRGGSVAALVVVGVAALLL